MNKVYVVTAPPSARGIYETWPECQAAVNGVKGARFMGVTSREKAESILDGEGVKLPPGRWAFTDANAAGGVGIVIVDQDAHGEATSQETSTTVQEILKDSGIPGLRTSREVDKALGDLHNILSEMSGFYAVLKDAVQGSKLAVVYDYKGVEKWMVEGGWKDAKSPVIAALVTACKQQIRDRDLQVSFQHQKGHSSTWAGRDDFARWNGRADQLATQASKS
ncbi:MAG: ribonuclease H family protein [Actinomycetota bacterium]